MACYQFRRKYGHTDRPRKERHHGEVCSAGGCNQPATDGIYCNPCYQYFRRHGHTDRPRKRRHAGEPCVMSECFRAATHGDYCGTHYSMAVSMGLVGKATSCSTPACPRLARVKGLCDSCYAYQRRHGTTDRPLKRRSGEGTITSHGYHDVKGVRQHRAVMEAVLGRQLREGETVHHRNGIRLDNRPENLEVWIARHPPGQRVEDVVRFAREILAEYGHLHPVDQITPL